MRNMESIRARSVNIGKGNIGKSRQIKGLLRNLIQRWDSLMSDIPEGQREPKDSFNVRVDGGINVSKQAIWRTIVVIFTLATGYVGVDTKIENATLQRDVVSNRTEIENNKKETGEKLEVFKSVIDGAINFLIEEKAAQKTQAAKERYQKQIQSIRDKMKPISKDKSMELAQPSYPLANSLPIFPREDIR